MRFVTTPSRIWLREAIASCRNEIIVASPFVGTAFNLEIKSLPARVHRKLITRTELTTFASRASDLESLIQFSEEGGEVRSLPGLHAKVYLIDRTVALVTSANATFSGLNRNWECGVVIEDAAQVSELAQLMNDGFGAPVVPQRWASTELKSLRNAVQNLQKTPLFAGTSRPAQSGDSAEAELSVAALQQVSSALPGWTQMTMRAIFALKTTEFEIKEVYRTGLPLARLQYPQNNSPREKLRQQLQRLRDLGILEFLGGGRYRLLAQEL
ncbi:MAG: phospholipase D-like domain-containing protein [Prosthecobacter sp.]|nr:phospholipase D-like domain-containing protein [Prosthecobacter sp.]